MSSSNNTFQRVQQAIENKYMGGIMYHTTARAWGQLREPVQLTTAPVLGGDATDGAYFRLLTSAVANNQSGWRVTSFHTTAQSPRLRMRFKINNSPNTTYRMFLGFTSRGAAPTANSDDWLNGFSGFGLALRLADTDGTADNFQIAHNDGTGATTFVDTGVAKDTNKHTLDLFMNAGTN